MTGLGPPSTFPVNDYAAVSAARLPHLDAADARLEVLHLHRGHVGDHALVLAIAYSYSLFSNFGQRVSAAAQERGQEYVQERPFHGPLDGDRVLVVVVVVVGDPNTLIVGRTVDAMIA